MLTFKAVLRARSVCRHLWKLGYWEMKRGATELDPPTVTSLPLAAQKMEINAE